MSLLDLLDIKKTAENGEMTTKFYNACKKYGFNNFSFEVLEFTEKDKLNEKEIYYIEQYKTNITEFGYNMTKGGDGLDEGQFRLKNILTNKQFIGDKNMISDIIKPATVGYITAKCTLTNKYIFVTKEEFYTNINLVGSMKDTVTVRNLLTNKYERVSVDEYKSSANLVGTTTGMVSVFNILTEEKVYISKDKYKNNKNIKYIKHLRPWHAPKVKSSKNSLFAWSQANKIKNMLDIGLNTYEIQKYYSAKIEYIVIMLKTKNWDPLIDEKWVKDFKH